MSDTITHSACTPAQVENWLFEQGDWVTRDQLCQRFGISERDLRPRGGKPGLLEGCAISRYQGGYIHIDLATPAECNDYINRLRIHGRMEIDRANQLFRRRLAGPRRAARPSS
jgi:hypothetical protein